MVGAKALHIVWVVVELLVLVYVLQATLPLLFALDFTNSSVWGTFGAAILPIVFKLLLAAAVLFIIITQVVSLAKGSGKGAYGM